MTFPETRSMGKGKGGYGRMESAGVPVPRISRFSDSDIEEAFIGNFVYARKGVGGLAKAGEKTGLQQLAKQVSELIRENEIDLFEFEEDAAGLEGSDNIRLAADNNRKILERKNGIKNLKILLEYVLSAVDDIK
jgi:hypothetical protein